MRPNRLGFPQRYPPARETRRTPSLKPKISDNEVEAAKPPLQDLSNELKNMVLELVLASDQPIKISKLGRHQMPGILQVNREFRNAGLKMYYSNNDFRAIITGEHPDAPWKWASEIALFNLHYIRSFTFDYRLTTLDYRMWFLRLSRTDQELQDNPDRLWLMSEEVRRQVGSCMFKFDDVLDLAKVHIHVDLGAQDIPQRLRGEKRALRTFLAASIATMICLVEVLADPALEGETEEDDVEDSVILGLAMVGPLGRWDLVIN
jgi:hypothetical protein